MHWITSTLLVATALAGITAHAMTGGSVEAKFRGETSVMRCYLVLAESLAELVRDIVYPGARLVFDTEKPDGTPRKLLDVTRLHELGWRHRIARNDKA